MITKQLISLNSLVVQGKGNIASMMGEEKVMLSISNGKYYNLGEIGGDIWELVKEPIQVNELVESLLTRFTVERSECEEHVLDFLHDLYKENLIEIISENI